MKHTMNKLEELATLTSKRVESETGWAIILDALEKAYALGANETVKKKEKRELRGNMVFKNQRRELEFFLLYDDSLEVSLSDDGEIAYTYLEREAWQQLAEWLFLLDENMELENE